MKKRALISVSDKIGVLEFAKSLIELGFEVISTGGTYEHIKQDGVIGVEDVTGFPEMLGGRVKTLHPNVHGGILAKRNDAAHMSTLESHDISTIDLIAINLYPFANVLKQPDSTHDALVENIDIGGPTMIRSAAKNHEFVVVLVDSADYETVLCELKSGGVKLETKKRLAAKAFRHIAAYDAIIADYLGEEDFPEKLTLTYELKQSLRYGENPHQSAALYESVLPNNSSILSAKQLHGKELSYNNVADADMALGLIREFDVPTAAVIKHQNPCGVGMGEAVDEAFALACEADPVSIFGGIVALNREVDGATAKLMQPIFLEIIIAPGFSDEALKILTKKKSLRLLEAKFLGYNDRHMLTSIEGGLLVQNTDTNSFDAAVLQIPTDAKPSLEQLKTVAFAWKVVKYVKSNAILVAKDGMTLGIGAGQTSRVGAAKIALDAAGERAQGAVLASDAMLPMPDTVELAAKAGISVIIQTGGSVKDEEVTRACNKHGIAMIFTGVRHFRH